MLHVHAAGKSDIGRRRANNEDSLYCGTKIWAVADGMGGHAAGEIASAMAISVLAELDESEKITPELVEKALENANTMIYEYGIENNEARGLGTTVTGMALIKEEDGGYWLSFNIGDSRIYRYRDEQLCQLTVDHSEAQKLVTAGIITREEARNHPLGNLLTRALGSDIQCQIDLAKFPVSAKPETYLLCTDGLYNELSDLQIQNLLTHENPVPDLIHAAKENGGRDNITALALSTITEIN